MITLVEVIILSLNLSAIQRRKEIIRLLLKENRALKGSYIANKFSVTRQIVVKDIAILRAEGHKIIATPEGYIISSNDNILYKRIFAVCHSSDDIKEEFSSIIKYGGIIEDVIVEHPVYGELKSMLMIKTLNDIENFIDNFNNNDVKPLSILTSGVHLHTVSAESEEILNQIEHELKLKNMIIT